MKNGAKRRKQKQTRPHWRGGIYLFILCMITRTVDHWLSQHDSLNKFDLCVMLSIWIKFEVELKCTCVYTTLTRTHNADGNGQVNFIYTCIVKQMHINLGLCVCVCALHDAHKMVKQSEQHSPNESMFTYIVHAYGFVFPFDEKSQTLCLNR